MDKIEITPELLAALKDKAKAATPGPWLPITCSNSYEIRTRLAGRNFAYAYTRPDGEYIAAASPDVVLVLIAEIETLRNNMESIDFSCNITGKSLYELYSEAHARAERLEKEAGWHSNLQILACCADLAEKNATPVICNAGNSAGGMPPTRLWRNDARTTEAVPILREYRK